jgi:hypothetical protein
VVKNPLRENPRNPWLKTLSTKNPRNPRLKTPPMKSEADPVTTEF